MPVQPNPNTNNKAIQNIDIHNVPSLSITPIPCDEIKLRLGRIIKIIIEDAPSSELDKESGEKPYVDTEYINEPIIELAEPPFPERLEIIKTVESPSFNLLGELQNMHVKIPLLQVIRVVPIYADTVRELCIKKPIRKPRDPLIIYVVRELSELILDKTPLLQEIRDVPIYAKTLRYLCIKKPRRKPRDLLIVHIVGELYELMLGKTSPIKYGDLGNPTITVKIGQTFIP
jgi:hypothetical protein